MKETDPLCKLEFGDFGVAIVSNLSYPTHKAFAWPSRPYSSHIIFAKLNETDALTRLSQQIVFIGLSLPKDQ